MLLLNLGSFENIWSIAIASIIYYYAVRFYLNGACNWFEFIANWLNVIPLLGRLIFFSFASLSVELSVAYSKGIYNVGGYDDFGATWFTVF